MCPLNLLSRSSALFLSSASARLGGDRAAWSRTHCWVWHGRDAQVYHRIAKKMLALADIQTDQKPLEDLRISSYESNLSELSTEAAEAEQFNPENELRLVQEDEIETMRRELHECGFKERIKVTKTSFLILFVIKTGHFGMFHCFESRCLSRV